MEAVDSDDSLSRWKAHPLWHRDPGFIESLRLQLLPFATNQLADQHLAEDVVQETLLAAFQGADRFRGRAALKTWVFAILKNKIADALRKRRRGEVSATELDADGDGSSDDLFDRHGHWVDAAQPQGWGRPEETTGNAEFWRVIELCLDKLPAQQSRVFLMREVVQLDTAEICGALNVTVSNLNVLLYRARLRLRECLEDCWFERGEQC